MKTAAGAFVLPQFAHDVKASPLMLLLRTILQRARALHADTDTSGLSIPSCRMLAQGHGQHYVNPTGERSESLKQLNRQVAPQFLSSCKSTSSCLPLPRSYQPISRACNARSCIIETPCTSAALTQAREPSQDSTHVFILRYSVSPAFALAVSDLRRLLSTDRSSVHLPRAALHSSSRRGGGHMRRSAEDGPRRCVRDQRQRRSGPRSHKSLPHDQARCELYFPSYQPSSMNEMICILNPLLILLLLVCQGDSPPLTIRCHTSPCGSEILAVRLAVSVRGRHRSHHRYQKGKRLALPSAHRTR